MVHDWLVTYGGGERVLREILACFPDADLFCIVEALPAEHRDMLRGRRVQTSFIQRLPGGKKHYWYLAPLMPLAVEQFDLDDYDLVVSSSHTVALGARTGPDQVHVSYVHSPMRFAWDLQGQYLSSFGYRRGLRSAVARIAFHYFRLWDRSASVGVDDFVANSTFVARRISKLYGRPSTVIHPPVDVGYFTPGAGGTGGYFLAGSRMNPFKRIDLVVEAFASLPDQRLVVVGDGPDLAKVRALAGPNVELVGHLPRDDLRRRMREAVAFVHAATEDFGIAMAEAQACGTPVVAYGRGGAVDIVRDLDDDEPTGVLFTEQTASGVAAGVRRLLREGDRIDPAACRANAMRFSDERFRCLLSDHIDRAWSAHDG